jgi:hypothetical protein
MRLRVISNPYINHPFLYDGGRFRKSSPPTTEFYFPVWL